MQGELLFPSPGKRRRQQGRLFVVMIYIDKIFTSGADMMCLILDVVPTVVYEKTDHKNTFT